MSSEEIYTNEHIVKSWFLEDELSGIDQPKMEDVMKTCKFLNLEFNKRNAFALIYGDNRDIPERIPPVWLSQLPD